MIYFFRVEFKIRLPFSNLINFKVKAPQRYAKSVTITGAFDVFVF